MFNRPTDVKKGAAAKAGTHRRSFWRDEDGAFIIFGLAIFMMMLLAGGIGVDIMRYEAHRSKVQQTLDRAILAAASLQQTLPADEVVLDYFTKAGLGHLITADDIDWSSSLTARRVEASVDLQMPTTFLRLASLNSLRFISSGGAQEAASLTEISLVLDASGSMDDIASSTAEYVSCGRRCGYWTGTKKIDLLKSAAKEFVNTLMCAPSENSSPDSLPNEADCTIEPGNVSINVVPYSEQVVLGADLMNRMQATTEHTSSHCVTFTPDEFGSVALDYDPTDGSDPLQRTGHFDDYSSHNYSVNHGNAPCRTDSWREVTVFEDSLSDLHSAIGSLGASGSTSIDLGMKWGAALLDPSFQDILEDMIDEELISEDYETRPFDYDTRGIEKVIVLMSDGENYPQGYLNEGYHDGPSGIFYANDDRNKISVYDPDRDQYYWPHDGQFHDHAYGDGEAYEHCDWVRYGGRRYSYWVWECNWVDEGDGATEYTFPEIWARYPVDWYEQHYRNIGKYYDAADEYDYYDKNAHLNAMCTAAKEAGMLVFTIGMDVQSAQDTIMRNCASDETYYYDVEGTDITTAFKSIALEISKLRLVY